MLNKIITIKSFEEGANGKKLVLKDENGDKFNLWKNKVSGEQTKAYSYFSTHSIGLDSKIEIAYKSEPKEYNGHAYEERTILKIDSPNGHATREASNSTKWSNSSPSSIPVLTDDFKDKVRVAYAKLDKRIGALETLMEAAGFKEALDAHLALEDTAEVKQTKRNDFQDDIVIDGI